MFVDFTAAWCVTCQVNEQRGALQRRGGRRLRAAGVGLLKADWTDRDAAIEKALADQGRVGVPLYLVYPASGAEPEVLPQILTEGAVVDAARRAAATS